MAINTKNKYPADKAGTKYSEFKNTKRTPPGKAHTKQPGGGSHQTANQTAGKT